MPWGDILPLEKMDSELHDIYLIQGVGLTSNIYYIHDDLIVDTGNGDPNNRIEPKLNTIGLNLDTVKTVVLTHSHFDHIGGLTELIETVHPKIMAHPHEHEEIRNFSSINPVSIDEGTVITSGDYTFHVLHTPGHTSGGICLYEEKRSILISGDTVFSNGGFGRTDLATGNTNDLLQSIKRISNLKVRHLLPGHEEIVVKEASSHIQYSLKNITHFSVY